MKINTKITYGLRTMIEIASASNVKGIMQKDISTNQKLSLKYLDQILSCLKKKGLILNLKGKGNGYILTSSAAEITMYDIFSAFEPIICIEQKEDENFQKGSLFGYRENLFWTHYHEDYIAILKKYTLLQILDENYK